jgi:hypothetical protein
MLAVDRAPTAGMTKRAVTASPLSVRTVHKLGVVIEDDFDDALAELDVGLRSKRSAQCSR